MRAIVEPLRGDYCHACKRPLSGVARKRGRCDWRHRNRTRQLVALAVGLRRLTRRRRLGALS